MKFKKIIPIVLIAILSLTVVCAFIIKNVNHNTTDNGNIISSDKASVDKGKKDEEKLAKKVDSKGKDTLLIYMVGSDLESRSGAGTDDLREIEESGINLKKANVLVYAGGAQKWHNDSVNSDKNTILQLGKKGFEPVAKMDSSNMGESATLLEFLNYSCENYPSDSYSLIMWDHGNGPIIGYGKDMLFDNDSLTLLEMDNALKASPFGKGKKLEWVGFDACLMSSAELVCIWDNYAKYLIASQEVEPSFGWNYSFLKDFGQVETTTLTKNIVDQYISACTAYYQKRGYDDRDTTLACMNLAYAGELESAINGLFAKADADVYTQYNTLVSKRVETRALGRASTGSEYDLIDLNDMAEQLCEVYPDETKKISDIVKKIVIKNGTNTQGCCGLSLYYPFYNKYYYEDSWGDAYGNLGLFSNYKSYLNKYQEIWLKDDKLDEYATSNTPVEEDTRSGFEFDKPEKTISKKYKLQLTKEQNENYAEAKIYILAKRGKDKYHVVFSDNNVINNNGVLTFDFEGKGIYVKNKFSEYYLPVSIGYDTVGDTNRYALKIRGKKIEGQELQDALFNITLNKKTGEVHLSSINPDSKPTTRNIVGGKLEELDINNWDYIFPMKHDYKYLQRYDNGVVKPIEEWVGDRVVSWHDFCVKDEIEFVYSSLDDGDYSIIFEITDTQNNKYCSEPLAIEVEAEKKEIYKPAEININWNDGERIKIFEFEGASLYLKKVEKYKKISYVLEGENNNNHSVDYVFDNIVINGNIFHGFASLHNSANKTDEGISSITIDELTKVGAIDSIFSISGRLSVDINHPISEVEKVQTIEKNQIINIKISGSVLETNLLERFPKYEFSQPFFGASSREKELFNNGKIKMTLLNFGKAEGLYSCGFICVENLTPEEQAYTIDAYSINGYTFDSGGGRLLPGRTKRYEEINISSTQMAENNISSINSFKIKISLYQTANNYYNRLSDESIWIDSALDIDSIPNEETDTYEKETLFDKNKVKIIINEYGINRGKPEWKITVENNSDEDITVRFGEKNNVSSQIFSFTGDDVGAHNKMNCTLSVNKVITNAEEFKTRIYIMDSSETQILFTSDEMIVLHAEPLKTPHSSIDINWNQGDKKLLDDRNGVSISVRKFDWYGKLCYALEFQNNRRETVSFEITDVIINGNIIVDNTVNVYVDANQTKTDLKIPYFTAATDLGVIDEINSIEFKIKETNYFVLTNSLNDQVFNVNISGEAIIKGFDKIYVPFNLSKPYKDAIATKQDLISNNEIKIVFLGLGKGHQQTTWDEGYYKGDYGFCVENTSSVTQLVTIEGLAINGAFISQKQEMKIPPKCKAYFSGSVSDYDLEPYDIISIEEIAVAFTMADIGSQVNKAQLLWVPIKLDELGSASNFVAVGEKTIFNKNGVKISVDNFRVEENGDSVWEFTLLNETADNISIHFMKPDGAALKSSVTNIKLGPKQYQKVQARFFVEVVQELEFNVVVKDYFGNSILFESEAPIKINNQLMN